MTILKQGRNCWRKARADRVTFLIDGADYFAAFRAAVEKAQRSIVIVGWDINSHVRLVQDESACEWPYQLGDFLNAIVKRRPYLHVHILVWDFAMIYALEREPPPLYKRQWHTHRRLDFYMDDKHPVGACHHQKIVVIDDALAFVGGLDLTKCRWDTPEHRINDDRRVTYEGDAYPPFHDAQMMADGELASLLGDLVRERWRRAADRELPTARINDNDPWPDAFKPDMRDVVIAVARTEPAYQGRPEVREVECLYLDALAAAQHSIYIENQYLTSARVGKALANSLRKEEGPDIVLVLPRRTSGWLEQATMDVLRARLLKTLRQADRYGRLRVYYPTAEGLGDEGIIVHSKVLIIDDTLVRIGSSNLSNRSMGLDTECDLAVEAGNREDLRQTITGLRNRLLAEHLGVEPEQVAQALVSQPSLITAIESLRGRQRTLKELDGSVPEPLEQAIPDAALIDPEQPLDPEQLTIQFIPETDTTSENRSIPFPWIKGLIILGIFVLLAASWRWTPLGEWLDAETLAHWAEGFRDSPVGPLMIIASFLFASLLAFPVTILIMVTALIFGPMMGFLYSLIGTLLGAAVSYEIGNRLGRNTVRRLTGSRINRLSRQLGHRGLLTMAVVRMVPVAPFTVVNMVAGASHIRFRDYILGTLLGMGPGMLGLTVFADSVVNAVNNPEPANFAWIAAVIAVVGVALFAIRRLLSKRSKAKALAEGKA